VLIAGGDTSEFNATSSAEVYDPVAGTFTIVGGMHAARDHFVAARFPSGPLSGQVILAGGNQTSATSSAELFDPTTGTFALTDSMTTPRVFHVAAMLNSGKYLVAGGVGTSTAELYDPATEKFTATGSMISGHALSTATLLPSGQVMIIAGQNTGSFITNEVDVYAPTTGTFALGCPLIQFRQLHASSLLNDGHVLVTGGEIVDSVLSSAELSP